ncbi:MAG: hypothetical protein KIT79_15950 [Deltaproteobacteria bacterium]|nr:hypothetical protein [Deltaproteobacteria bacterium]
MQGTVASEIEWRLSLYRSIIDFCREGGFSFGRFLALVPSRLRLAVGESAAKMRIPVALPENTLTHWKALLMPAAVPPLAGPCVNGTDELRRAIRYAQIGSDIDPVGAALWFPASGRALAADASSMYLKGFAEVGAGEGGDETAYLVHLLVVESLRKAIALLPDAAHGVNQCIVPPLLQLGLKGLLETGAVEGDALSARLGFQFAVTVSPLSMGASVDDLLTVPVNPYRTTAGAVSMARKLLPEAIENTDLEQIHLMLTDRLAADATQKATLSLDLLAEVVRDLLLLILLQTSRLETEKGLQAGRQMAASGKMLESCLADPRKREQFRGWADGQKRVAGQPAEILGAMLVKAPQVMAGQMEPLGRHGDLKARARLAAAGAIVLVLDERVERMKQDILKLVDFLPPVHQESTYRSGKCYRLEPSPAPLYQIAEERQEAHLFVDLKDFTKRTASIKEAAMGDFLRRYFYAPIFDLARKLQNGNEKALAISNIVGDAAGFRGEIMPMVSLALGIRDILKQAAEELVQNIPDILGGGTEAVAEIDAEIGNWSERLREIDSSMAAASAGSVHQLQMAAARKEILDRIEMLNLVKEERIAGTVGYGVEAGAYVAFGAAAEVVDLSQVALGLMAPAVNEASGYTSVTIAERLNEAARGTARSGILRAERELRVQRAREERKSPRASMPFQVSVGRSYQLDVPVSSGDAISEAITSGDKAAATAAIQEFARLLHGKVQEQVKSRGGLPDSLNRSAEFYNAGCAMSAASLEAYRAAAGESLKFQEITVPQSRLPAEFLSKWVFEFDVERFQVVTRTDSGALMYVLRYAGEASFKGFEKEGGIGVWEIILADSPFARDLVAWHWGDVSSSSNKATGRQTLQ